jgi:hypothetical protein
LASKAEVRGINMITNAGFCHNYFSFGDVTEQFREANRVIVGRFMCAGELCCCCPYRNTVGSKIMTL